MKRITLLLLTLVTGIVSFAQDLPDFGAIQLDKKEDYDAIANKAALAASSYLLSTPSDKKNQDRLKAAQYLIRWMTGTPEYNFTLDADNKLLKKNDDLLVVYMAGMSKYALENKEASADTKMLKLNSIRAVLQYAKDPANKVKQTSDIRKAIEAEEKGQLAEYLKL